MTLVTFIATESALVFFSVAINGNHIVEDQHAIHIYLGKTRCIHFDLLLYGFHLWLPKNALVVKYHVINKWWRFIMYFGYVRENNKQGNINCIVYENIMLKYESQHCSRFSLMIAILHCSN